MYGISISGNAQRNSDETSVRWLKQCHKTAMTGNGKHITYKHGEIAGLFLFI